MISIFNKITSVPEIVCTNCVAICNLASKKWTNLAQNIPIAKY